MPRLIAANLLAILLAGCSNKPQRVTIPDWDPSGFTSAILEQLDKNGDSAVDSTELAKAPGLAYGAKLIDNDKDGKLSREELEARFAKYRDRELGLTSKEFRICRAATGEAPALWVMEVNGGNPRQLTRGWQDGGADHPQWLSGLPEKP